jgi:hypothetical protein
VNSLIIPGMHIPYALMWAVVLMAGSMAMLAERWQRQGRKEGRAWNAVHILVALLVCWLFIEIAIGSVVWYLNWPGR